MTDPQVTIEGLNRLIKEIRESAPVVVVHPDDVEMVQSVTDQLFIRPIIEINEWATQPGSVIVFVGTKKPIYDLGSV